MKRPAAPARSTAAELVDRTAVGRGLPATINDPLVLARVAALVKLEDGNGAVARPAA